MICLQIAEVHVDRHPIAEVLSLRQRQGNGGDIIDEQSTEASMKRSSPVGVLGLDPEAGHTTTNVTVNKTTLSRVTRWLGANMY